MAVVSIEGFDHWVSGADALGAGWTIGGAFTALPLGRNSYGKAITTSAATNGIGRPLASATTYVVGFAFSSTSVASQYTLVSWGNTGNTIQSKRLLSLIGGQLQIEGGGAPATSAAPVGGGYHYIEHKIALSAGNEVHTVRVDGVVVISYSVATTLVDLGALRLGNVLSGADNVALGTWDDVYVLDTTGTRNNDFLGDSRVVLSTADTDVSGPGVPSSGSTKWAMVDDASIDSDATYYTCSVNLQADGFQTSASLPTTPAAIHAINFRISARKTDAGAATIYRQYKDSGIVVYTPPDIPNLSTTYVYYDDYLQALPSGAVPTPANLNQIKWYIGKSV